MTPSDQDLIRRLRVRDSAAFEALHAAYGPPVRAHLVRMLRDPAFLLDQARDWQRAVGSGNSPLAAEIMADFAAIGRHPNNVLLSGGRGIQEGIGKG